jgi:hypothetical protein
MKSTNPSPIIYTHTIPAKVDANSVTPFDAVIGYLVDSKQPGVSLGMATANDPTFIAGLMQGFVYAPSRMIALFQYIAEFYTAQLALEAAALPMAV